MSNGNYQITFPNKYGFPKASEKSVLAAQKNFGFSNECAEFLRTQNGYYCDGFPESAVVKASEIESEGTSDLRALYGLDTGGPHYELIESNRYNIFSDYCFEVGSTAGGNPYVEVLVGKHKGWVGSLDHDLFASNESLKEWVEEFEIEGFFEMSKEEQADTILDPDLGLIWFHATSFNEFIYECIHAEESGWLFVKDADSLPYDEN